MRDGWRHHVEQLLYREREVAHALGVSVSQVAQFRRCGLLTPIPVPGTRAKRYSPSQVRGLAEKWSRSAGLYPETATQPASGQPDEE
jgi:DNA-binding transcriptional MerR regulator